MKPTWQADGVDLYLGDCLEVLPSLSGVDAVVTDPPYGTENGNGYGRRQNYTKAGRTGRTIAGDTTLEVMLGMLSKAPGGRCTIFASPRNQLEAWNGIRELGWNVAAWLIWNKTVPGLGYPIQYQHELVGLLFRSGKAIDRNAISVLDYFPESRIKATECHPHQKPLALMQKLVGLYDCNVICDPFMGSGTTGIACIRTGRRFIGIEKDPVHFETARSRIERELAQGRFEYGRDLKSCSAEVNSSCDTQQTLRDNRGVTG